MTRIKAAQLKENLFETLDNCLKDKDPLTISLKKRNLVLMSEEEFSSLQETAFINSIPGLSKSIIKGINTPISKCKEINLDEF